ncbi:Response regulator of citrate/malate metabolism [Agromyces sp. CF514]|uniref:response regulator n=1 Tax=Agromyces sp. CF514 TaxID=1881031 RepID=UPI0008E06172|nr:response regulator [Agromyces sp. CF514]SFR70248.1 Response regulator of citrate/malate metabolism [Agromyces sp. CF514]
MTDVRVLVVDDEPITAEAHAEYLRRLDGFAVAGVALNGKEAIRLLRDSLPGGDSRRGSIDLVLLDMNLPDIHGIELCRRIRTAGLEVDVIAISAVRDVSVVRASVNLGIVAYLIKPFTFPVFADRMRSYVEFRAGFAEGAGVTTQDEVDQTLARLRSPGSAPLEKGLAGDTLGRIVKALRGRDEAVSASELAAELAISRVTARRYLEHLADDGSVERAPRYGTPGRPELEYRWRLG